MTEKLEYDEENLSHDDADHEKNEDGTLSHDEEDDKTQQIRKLYVLHVMIETTTTTTTTNKQTNPKIIRSAVHLSKKIVQKDTNILLQKKIKERDASASFGK